MHKTAHPATLLLAQQAISSAAAILVGLLPLLLLPTLTTHPDKGWRGAVASSTHWHVRARWQIVEGSECCITQVLAHHVLPLAPWDAVLVLRRCLPHAGPCWVVQLQLTAVNVVRLLRHSWEPLGWLRWLHCCCAVVGGWVVRWVRKQSIPLKSDCTDVGFCCTFVADARKPRAGSRKTASKRKRSKRDEQNEGPQETVSLLLQTTNQGQQKQTR